MDKRCMQGVEEVFLRLQNRCAPAELAYVSPARRIQLEGTHRKWMGIRGRHPYQSVPLAHGENRDSDVQLDLRRAGAGDESASTSRIKCPTVIRANEAVRAEPP